MRDCGERLRSNLDGIADEVDGLDGAARAEDVAVDALEAIHAQREIVEVPQAAERVRLELGQHRIARYDERLEIGQVAEGEHADRLQVRTIRDHDRLQSDQAL